MATENDAASEGSKPESEKQVEQTTEQKRIAELETANRLLTEEKDKARGYAVALTQRLAEMSQTQQQRESQIPEPERREAIKRELEENPEETLDAHFQQRIAPMMQSQHQMIASMQKEQFINKIGPDKWKRYREKVEAFVQPFSADTMARPGAWEQAFNFVRAENIDAEIEERMREQAEQRNKQTMLESGASGGAQGAANRGLTDLEKLMMNEFGMNEKEWRAYGSRNLSGPVPTEE